jgi:tetratricopeptide (TPR) repeat protein
VGRTHRIGLLSLVAILLPASCLVAPLSLARTVDQQGDDKPAPPAKLMSGMGALHHPIATKNAEAQKFFDQGLTLIYAFNHAEAARSFQRAAELDPREPMPQWGLALALGPNYNAVDVDPQAEKAAYDASQKALTLSSSAPENERAYAAVLAKRFTTDPKADFKRLARDYAAAMRDLSRNNPDDPDAATLYAEALMDLNPWQLWSSDGKPGPDTPEIVSVLESVLRRWPDHVGANHFYIHAMEASPNPEYALPSAKRLEALVPNAGHLVHMPAHIYERTGNYSLAAKSNVDAVAVDRNYLREKEIVNPVYSFGYVLHNKDFLRQAAAMEGDFDSAMKIAREIEADGRTGISQMPDMASMMEVGLPEPILVLARFAKWDDVLAVPQPDAKFPGLAFEWRYARAIAFAANGDAQKAAAERDAMEAAFKTLPNGPAFGMMFNTWDAVHDVAMHIVDARIAAARRDWSVAADQWRAAVSAQDKMRYNEPDDWYYPTRESLGAALLRGGNAAEAEKVFREDLIRHPRNPRSLFGLSMALEAQKKTSDAAWVKASFAQMWKGGALKIEDL